MHLKQVRILPEKFPIHDRYPFNLEIFSRPLTFDVHYPVTFFVGENGTGKSTLLQAISHRCSIIYGAGSSGHDFNITPMRNNFTGRLRLSGQDIPFRVLFLPQRFSGILPKSWMNGLPWIPACSNISAESP